MDVSKNIMTMDMLREPVVAYMRYSSDNQTENSIEYQRDAINAYCDANSLTIVEEYIDEAYSATNDRRPSFQRMMTDALRSPSWKKVLIFDMSRFSRKTMDALTYSNLLEDAGIELVSITQNFGKDNEGFLLKGITNLLNEYYSKNNAKHTHEAMKVKAKAGLHVGGIPPLGYDVGEDRKLIINEDEAECVRLIFELFELNYSKKRIAEILNERGFKNKLGQPFRATSLDSVLRQEKYTGTYIWNRAHKANSEGKKNSHKSKPQEEIITIEDGCPMIISREQFDRVQEMISEKSSGRSHSKSRNNYMLGGLRIIKCAECGSYMIGNPRTSHGRKYMVYSCPKHKKNQCSMKEISTELLDVTVAKELVKEFITEENVKIATDKRNCKEYRQLKNKLKGNEKASLNILKAVETSYSDIVADKLKYLATSRKELQSKIEEYERTMPKVTPGELKKIQDRIMSLLIKSDDPEVKIFLKKAVREIVVRSTEVKIIMN